MRGKLDDDASGRDKNSDQKQTDEFIEPYTPTPEEARARRRRNIAIALAIGVFAAFFYVITIAKLGVAVLDRPF